jgi:predicted enzyme related to lactoylglutathione lyase
MLLGLRTVIYAAPDLAAAKEWYTRLLGIPPYFDEAFYVGFNVGGYELGLDPNTHPSPGASGSVGYWGVANLDAALKRVQELDVVVLSSAQDVGGGIRVATIGDPAGNLIGLIENPHFKLP